LRRGDDLVAAVAPGPHRAVTAHLLVGREPLPADLSLRAVEAGAMAALRSGVEDLDELGSTETRRRGIERRVSVLICVPRGRGVEVAQLLALIRAAAPDADGTRDVVELVGTCALDELDRYGPDFAAVVESVRPLRS
jgi:hypothetical protein